MQMPTLQHRIVDNEAGVTIEIYGYRKLNDFEKANAIQSAIRQQRKKLKRGTTLKIVTTYN